MPEPVQEALDCSLDQLPPEEDPDPEEGVKRRKTSDVTLVDLFHKKRLKGWWPVFSSEEGERELMVSSPCCYRVKWYKLHVCKGNLCIPLALSSLTIY